MKLMFQFVLFTLVCKYIFDLFIFYFTNTQVLEETMKDETYLSWKIFNGLTVDMKKLF